MYKNHWPWEEKQDDPQTLKKKIAKIVFKQKMINRGHRSNSYMNPFIQCSSSIDTKHHTYGVFPQTKNYKT